MSSGRSRRAGTSRVTTAMRVSVFGFHLAPIDLRQSSDEHEATVAELLARAGVEANYAALDEEARVALLARELAGPRPLRSPHLEYSKRVQQELAVLAAAAEGGRNLGGSRGCRDPPFGLEEGTQPGIRFG